MSDQLAGLRAAMAEERAAETALIKAGEHARACRERMDAATDAVSKAIDDLCAQAEKVSP